MEYKKTLNMPQTTFEMKANLPTREPGTLVWWDEIDVYSQVQAASAGRPVFNLHDGPPYANGDIHVGTALNKILKDFVVKHAAMTGYHAPYVPGWDTHGLPIEMKALQEYNLDRATVSPVELRRRCAEFALKYMAAQREQFRRLGVHGDWAHPYLTMQPEYEAKQVEVFASMALQGHVYRGLKPVYWCTECETALAEAEIEYKDKRSPSIFVRFAVRDGKGRLPADAYVVIWTTTPWTLPGNLAIALHPEADYALYATEKGNLLLAAELAERVLAATGLTNQGVQGQWKGADLEGVVCRHPFVDRDSLVILGEHVTVEDGTGCVHTAPGHGHEDFAVGQKYGLEPLQPLDDRGYFTAKGGKYQGKFYASAQKEVLADLDANGALLQQSVIQHSYAHCWRCQHPVVYRATVQWFASVDGFREAAMRAIGEVQWVPAWGIDRIGNMVADRGDWCISRQRAWGVPIPIFTCKSCDEPLMTAESFGKVADLFRREGSDAWWLRTPQEILGMSKCPRCGGELAKERDIMDVWFDSGSSHAAVCEARPELTWPADLYLEGSDQHRGWFQSSLLTAVVYKGQAPYRAVVTHGYVVDETGRKMSKSLGNVVNPLDVCNQLGADVLRLWVASVDYTGDVPCSPGIIKQASEVYRKLRNTARFLLANLYDFHPDTDPVPARELLAVDRWIMHRLQQVIAKVRDAYRRYEYHTVYHELNRYATVDLSAVYMDVLKDRLYCDAPAGPSRRAAQTVLYRQLDALVRLLTPILAFTTEEIWQHMPKPAGAPVSVQLLQMPGVDPGFLDDELGRDWDNLLEVRQGVAKVLEQARSAKEIGSSQEAAVHLYVEGDSLRQVLDRNLAALPGLFIVSAVRLYAGGQEAPSGTFFAEGPSGLRIAVTRAEGEKCQRCWHYRPLGTVPDYADLCDRCAGVVVGLNVEGQG